MERRELRRAGFRFWLRPVQEGDGDAIFEAAAEAPERVARWMDWLTPSYSPRESTEWARTAADDWAKDDAYEFVIIDSIDGAVSGCCGLNRVNRKDLVCNLGYWVRESKSRQGAASEAARLLWEFGLTELGMGRIEIVIADGNTASGRVAEKLPALYEGKQRMRLRIGDRSHDAHMYALLANATAEEVPSPAHVSTVIPTNAEHSKSP